MGHATSNFRADVGRGSSMHLEYWTFECAKDATDVSVKAREYLLVACTCVESGRLWGPRSTVDLANSTYVEDVGIL